MWHQKAGTGKEPHPAAGRVPTKAVHRGSTSAERYAAAGSGEAC